MFRVIDLKQFVYCPRLIYYHYCLPHIRPTTYKMEAGVVAQRDERTREVRRSLSVYGLSRGERVFGAQLASDTLKLRGKVDMYIITDDNPQRTPEVIPVDYKNSTHSGGNTHLKLQLMAYGLLLEESLGIPARRGFLYYIPRKKAHEVPFTARLKGQLRKYLAEMEEIALREQMPDPTPQRAKCTDCEFRRFCNDI